ncbi:hypothetical protein FN846DRAFT_889778 [Sphaerosporella brunnea]|uniref:Uncharacterized protein n=1 Tax=Sphaerosporella brunnea TaxID=1250544 RepID=A0A5J5EYP8_9PEZI|nr:hypothetical protein FN846DRAFT_889778 [Sphaerosporella brunnea]
MARGWWDKTHTTDIALSSVTLQRRSQRLKAKGGVAKKSTKAARTIRYGLTQQPSFNDNLRWTTGRFEKLPQGRRFSGLTRLTVPWSTEWVDMPKVLDVTAKASAKVHDDLEDDNVNHERSVSPSLYEEDEDEQFLDESTEPPAEVANDLDESDDELARAIALSLKEDGEDEELLHDSAEAATEVLKDSDMYDDEDTQFVADLARAKAQSMIDYLSLEEIMVQEREEAGYASEEDSDSLDEIVLNGVVTTDYQPDEGNDLGFDGARFEEVWESASAEERDAEAGWGMA